MGNVTSVGFDARYIRIDHHDGISRFSARVGSELYELVRSRDDFAVTFIVSDERQLEHLPPNASHVFASAPTSMAEGGIAKRLNVHGFDVVYSPMQTMGARGRKFKLVLTVHDLIYYSHRTPPRQFNFLVRALWRIYHLSWWPQRHLLNRADFVVAVSSTTANLIRDNRLTRNQVGIVYNASDLSSQSGVAKPLAPSHRTATVIYMGSFMPYKNVAALVEAANQMPDVPVKLLSRIHPKDRQELERLIRTGDVEFLDGVSDDEYLELLMSSRALIMPSRDEGFGIPVVEAMAAGTPVICSDIDIFHEIAGTAASFVAVDNPAGIARAVRALGDEATFQVMQEAGLRQAEQFNWRKSAEALLDILKQVTDS